MTISVQRLAVLADIHGNAPALAAVLAELHGHDIDLVVVAGDALSGPFPAETLRMLDEIPVPTVFIRGNGERELADPPDEDDPTSRQTRWTADRIDPSRLQTMAGFNHVMRVGVDGLGPVCVCHGSPRRDDEILTTITPEDRLRIVLGGTPERTVICGHTHTQFDRTIDDVRIVNAGSIGMPYEHEPGAYWLLLGPDVARQRTPYDITAAADAVRASGYPDADAFARSYIETRPSPDEAAAFFESRAGESTDSGSRRT